MSKILVVYWSGSGNTEAMANAIVEGIESVNGDVHLAHVSENPNIEDYDKVIFGCPAMGCENLEDGEFEPYFAECESKLTDKKIALFGSYGWGGGEWMYLWTDRCKDAGAIIYGDGLICNEAPDDDVLNSCVELGKEFVSF